MKKIFIVLTFILGIVDTCFFGVLANSYEYIVAHKALDLVFYLGLGLNILFIIVLTLLGMFIYHFDKRIMGKLDDLEENNDVRHKQTQEIIMENYEKDHMEE